MALALPGLLTTSRAAPEQAVVAVYEAVPETIKDDVRSVARTADGMLLVGSNVLAAFDGENWQPIDVPGAYGFRALAAAGDSSSNRVWVGAIGAVGFAEPDTAGTWHYTSLRPQLAAAGLPVVGDVWAVRSLGAGALWVTDAHAFRWTPATDQIAGHFDVWPLPAKSRLAAFGGGASAWVHQEGVGLWRFESNGAPTLVLRDAELPASPVTWLVPVGANSAEAWLGLGDAAYLWHETSGLTRRPILSNALNGSVPTDAVGLSGGGLAIATFDRGIYVAAERDEPPAHLSTDQGLPDTSVYSLLADKDRLWLASPQGLARIEGAGRATLFEKHDALADGRPLDVVERAGDAFVLTTHDLLRQTRDNDGAAWRLEPVLHAPGAFADALTVSEELWITGFGGLWRLSGNETRQELFAPNDVLCIAETKRYPSGRLFLEGYALRLLLPSAHGGWAAHDLGAAVTDSPVSLYEDSDGDVWVSTMQQGVVRFRWDRAAPPAPPRLQIARVYRPGAGLPPQAGRVQLVPLGRRLFAFTDAGILSLRADNSEFAPVPELAAFLGVASSRPKPDLPPSAYWLVRARSLAGSGIFAVLQVEPDAAGNPVAHELRVPGLDSVGAAARIADAGGALWIGGTRGLLRVEESAIAPAVPPAAPPLRVGHDERAPASFAFRFAVPAAGAARFYRTRLDGLDGAWSEPTRTPTRTYDGLGAGLYRFEVLAVDRFGRASPAVARAFAVPTPWWKTVPAFAGYAVLLVSIVGGAARWRIVRLRRQNERLNQLVAERTREIELASTAKSEFLDNVSHEIRNPLNGLTGLLALLKEERLDPRERELARSLKSIASTLTQVFDDVLQFSKLEYGYGRLEGRPFALRPLLEEIVSLFAAAAAQARCPLNLRWSVNLPDGFDGDPHKIKTIVTNFVSNALKYAPGAPVDVRVSSSGETDGMVNLFLEVVDRGPGVPPDEQELIFRKFVRGQRAIDSKIPGTGLGLATCRMLAKLMNGRIAVDSTPGGGSTFQLHLLLPRAPLAAATPPPDEPAPEDASLGPILIVDDEPYNRVVLAGIVRELGASAESVGSAEEAMKQLSVRDDYAVVFLDWELPDRNGGEVAQALRDRPNGHVPIILATTAHDSHEMRERCRDAGMDGFLLKPYNTAVVRRAIADARLGRTSPSASSAFTVSSSDLPLKCDDLDLAAFEHFTSARPGEPNAARQLYLEALESHEAIIAAAISERNARAVAREAHRLRALSGLIHAVALNRSAANLEQVAREGEMIECAKAWLVTERACADLKQQLGRMPPVTPRPASPDAPA